LNPLSPNILKAIVDEFSSNCFNKAIYGYIEIKKEGTIYRSDSDYQQKGS